MNRQMMQLSNQLHKAIFPPLEKSARNLEESSAIDIGVEVGSEPAADTRPVKRKDRSQLENGNKRRKKEARTTSLTPSQNNVEQHSNNKMVTGWQLGNFSKEVMDAYTISDQCALFLEVTTSFSSRWRQTRTNAVLQDAWNTHR
ncbi:hypothetical protein HELRODRAFT_175891 [Helobdella robusta]|uniref:Uncharacterized protein n=1 Tax=Helobdella robusta TaxID=6412 RepID=T1F9U6_HELRO|nr:hypothetical protein HELRODRAFT_175891 [Helobdella robusta]ESO00459.1 hypothetical protein HELRODRAFT_175891 [Helobdella robusta]